MLLRTFILESSAALSKLYPEGEAKSIVLGLCRHVLGTKPYDHILNPRQVIDEEKMPLLNDAMSRLEQWEPLQYVIGEADFFGRSFRISHNVLIPRPETEQLCSLAVDSFKDCPGPKRVIDLCCGSGCISWTLAGAFPEAELTAVDISPEALDLARSQHFDDIPKTPDFILSDVLVGCPGVEGRFDLIVSNPPYVLENEKGAMRRNVLDYEPSLALFVPDDDPLVFYRSIASFFFEHSSPSALCLMETNELLSEGVADLFRVAQGCAEISVCQDFFGKNRFVKVKK